MCVVVQRSPEPLLAVRVGALQVSELFLFPEMVDPPRKSERLPGSGKIEKDISERCLREMSARKEEKGAGGKGERI